jgi:hypothetical protein
MGRIIRWVVVAIGALALMLAALVFAVLDTRPHFNETAQLTSQHIEHAKRLLDANDPRRMQPGVLRGVVISQADLDMALNYLANRFGKGGARITLGQGVAQLQASVALPPQFLGAYVNVDAVLRQTPALPEFEILRLGHLPVPASLANLLLRRTIAHLQTSDDYALAATVVKSMTARPGMLGVVYAWNNQAADQLKGALVPKEDQARMKLYQARLADITNALQLGPNQPRQVPLSVLMQSLFTLAAERGGDLVAEHRAAIIVLTFYVNGKGLAHLVPQAQTWPWPRPLKVTLDGRHDFAQHFSISAALAATAGSPLADAVGLYKEVDDSRGGSGFSFNDIAADRAGTRFGDLVTANASGPRKLHPFLSAGLKDADLLPNVKDLPEFMQDADFKRRYGGIGGANYNTMMADIEGRIAGLALYR